MNVDNLMLGNPGGHLLTKRAGETVVPNLESLLFLHSFWYIANRVHTTANCIGVCTFASVLRHRRYCHSRHLTNANANQRGREKERESMNVMNHRDKNENALRGMWLAGCQPATWSDGLTGVFISL